MARRESDDLGVYILGRLYDTRVYDDDYGDRRGGRYGRGAQRGASRRGYGDDGPRLCVEIKTGFSSGLRFYFDAEEYEPIFDAHELGERVLIRARPAVSQNTGKLNWYDPQIIAWLDSGEVADGVSDDVVDVMSVLQSASARGRAGADSDINDLEEV